MLFVTANKLTTAANAIFLQATAPLYILLAAPWLLREKHRRDDVPFMLAVGAGMAAFMVGGDGPVDSAPNPSAGNVVAAASGVTYALTVMGLRGVARTEPRATLNTVVSGNLVAAAMCLPLGWPITGALPADWMALVWLGVFQIGLAYLCLSTGVRDVTALEASLLLLAEPVLNPVWAWLAHGERARAMGAGRGSAHCGCNNGAGGEGSQSALKRSQSVIMVSAASRRPPLAGPVPRARSGMMAVSTRRSRSARSAGARSCVRPVRTHAAMAACHARSSRPSPRAAAAIQ